MSFGRFCTGRRASGLLTKQTTSSWTQQRAGSLGYVDSVARSESKAAYRPRVNTPGLRNVVTLVPTHP